MIKEKEFPATHSMSTSWFGIDKDGNVAIFNFEDNGPVPQGLHEECEDSLILEKFVRRKGPFKYLPFTTEQALHIVNILEDATTFKAEDPHFETYIQINPNKQYDFEKFLIDRFESIPNCIEDCPIIINHEIGLYLIDFIDWSTDDLQTLIDSGLICKWRCFVIDTNGISISSEKEPQFMGMPFYLYQQDYSPSQMMELIYKPSVPLKSHQLHETIIDEAMKFDFRFDKKDLLQIAEYYPYNASESLLEYEPDFCANWLPVNSDTDALIREYTVQNYWCCHSCSLCEFCSDERYKNIEDFFISQAVDFPNIVILRAPEDEKIHQDEFLLKLSLFSICMPIIYGYPWVSWQERFDNVNKIRYNKVQVNSCFSNCKAHLEEHLEILNPYVIILSKNAFEYMKKQYSSDGNTILINNREFPIIFIEALSDHQKELENILKLPYRGKKINRILRRRKRKNDD